MSRYLATIQLYLPAKDAEEAEDIINKTLDEACDGENSPFYSWEYATFGNQVLTPTEDCDKIVSTWE